MLKALASDFLILLFFASVSAADNGFPRCICDYEGSFWSIILVCQRVSDFMITVAYFLIPIQLLYFVSCSNEPSKWVLFPCIAFIFLCGLTHSLIFWTYGPHSFHIMLALTVLRILTALVSCATALTLITFLKLVMKVKMREFMLKKKTCDLGREVGMILKQKAAGLHVRMLTQEIRKSLDRHTILYTTMFELSEALGLHYCAVWMLNENKTVMNLTHEMKDRSFSNGSVAVSIPITDPDVIKIKASIGVNFLGPDSLLIAASCGERGPAVAIRVPMLPVSNFEGGTPEVIPTCYAILVLVGQHQSWSSQEVEIIKEVAEQLVVALSHAALLDHSQLIREKLAEQNQALQQAKKNVMMASQASNSFKKVMSDGMRRPLHSIMGLLSILQNENVTHDQRTILNAMLRTGNVVSTLIHDVMDNSVKDSARFPLELELRPFRLPSVIKEAACLAKCLCAHKGCGFAFEVQRSLPEYVMGDETRVFQVILHMVGSLLNDINYGGFALLRFVAESGSQGRNDQRWGNWRRNSSDGDVYIRFEIGINKSDSHSEGFMPNMVAEERLSFTICKKLVKLMQGNIWVIPNSQGSTRSMALVLRFQLRPSISASMSEVGESSVHPLSDSMEYF